MSGLVQSLAEGSDEPNDSIPLLNVRELPLRKVMDYCEHHVDREASPISIPIIKDTIEEVVDEWDVRYLEEMTCQTLCDVITTASYLDVAPLVELLQAKIAFELMKKTPSHIALMMRKALAPKLCPAPQQPMQTFASKLPCDLLLTTLAYLPLRLLADLPGDVWGRLATYYTHLVIDCADPRSRDFFDRLPFQRALEWGMTLAHLERITVRQMTGAWGEEVWVGVVEGQASGHTSERPAKSVESIAFETVPVSSTAPCRSLLIPPLPPLPSHAHPSLPDLKTLTGVGISHTKTIDRRGWKMKALERVEGNMVTRDNTSFGTVLGGGQGLPRDVMLTFIATSESLAHLDVAMRMQNLADVVSAMSPAAVAGLKTLGPLLLAPLRRATPNDNDDWALLDQVKDMLRQHGSSLTSIKATLSAIGIQRGPRYLFPTLSALHRLNAAAGSTPQTLTLDFPDLEACYVDRREGPLSFSLPFIDPLLPPNTSGVFADSMSRLASVIPSVHWRIPSNPQTLAALDTPTEDEKRLASTFTFSKATVVSVRCDALPDNGPAPIPAILPHLPLDAHPNATRLEIHSGNRRGVVELLAAKMPALGEVMGVLKAIGPDKKLTKVEVCVDGLGEGGLQWGEEKEQLPEIEQLECFVVPDITGESLRASAEAAATTVGSLMKLRAIHKATVGFLGVPSRRKKATAEAFERQISTGSSDGFSVTMQMAPAGKEPSVSLTASRPP
ncbi:unnamed protein product [Vitrella brassicaformis CCMP3155]|uniref:SKP1 component POZ domain-containing protein n=1 Tax=Vitrella brassicaformis (strain CCMP3155) TaxID=1169540 RepID=A0A0G4EH65_VITBC|nr:unnamed protein product [Vitrella brassicaformis CCMP3155]|eukprot:CEL94714.1 unnamed protein product [Vitrella brassicaformis CCMP3155]